MDPLKFDELTKVLATSTSRRQALKTIAATTLGGILGLGGLGTAFAKNMTCAQWCAAVFGDNTPADEQCSADAAHHRGLCYSCGPASPNGGVAPSSICCARNSSGYCSSYSTTLPCSCNSSQCLRCDSTTGTCVSTCDAGQCQTCQGDTCVGCPSGQTCQGGQCVTPCTASGGTCSGDSDCCAGTCCQGTCCGSGQVCLSNGTCATPCSPPGSDCGCGPGSCTPEFVSSANYCAKIGGAVAGTCFTSSACPKGYFCAPGGFCVSVC